MNYEFIVIIQSTVGTYYSPTQVQDLNKFVLVHF